ncbi:MAG TPA: hypothetical protein VHV55_07005, partial [Pirellulales bacterium]|nr:hypothetical protein [Pirellulales bacterium]
MVEAEQRRASGKRRFLTFSLSTALLLMTAVGIGLTLKLEHDRLRESRAAADAVQTAGGKLVRDETLPRSLRSRIVQLLLGSDPFATVVEVDFTHHQPGDDVLRHLTRARHLRTLNLYGAGTTVAGSAHLKKLATLEDLSLIACPITDAGLANLAPLTHLKKLHLAQTQITDA